MSDITTVAIAVQGFYELVGTEPSDSELTARGESTNDIAYRYLTRGCRRAQRWMLKGGYAGWRARSPAVTWTGSDADDGGRSFDLTGLDPLFLRLYGDERRMRSALVEPNGRRWGQQIEADEDTYRGNYYYVRGEELWLARGAQPPTTVYIDYHYRHAPFTSSLATIDFPLEARPLIVAEAAHLAKDANWLPGGEALVRRIMSARSEAQKEARDVARSTKEPRRMKRAPRFGNHF